MLALVKPKPGMNSMTMTESLEDLTIKNKTKAMDCLSWFLRSFLCVCFDLVTLDSFSNVSFDGSAVFILKWCCEKIILGPMR